MIKNIVFDIGNVLLNFQPEEFLQQYYDKSVMGDLMTIIFSSQEWIELDLGTMMIKDVIHELARKHPHYHEEIIFVLENWTQMMTPLQENVDIAYQLAHKGYHLYLLSNFHSEAIQTMFDQYEFFQIFEGGIISAHEHVVKPDEKIYQLLFERYHLDPQECLFIDDSLGNINAARRLNMTGIHLPYQAHLKKELETLQIL